MLPRREGNEHLFHAHETLHVHKVRVLQSSLDEALFASRHTRRYFKKREGVWVRIRNFRKLKAGDMTLGGEVLMS